MRSAMRAASQLPERGPTVVDMAPVPACYRKNSKIWDTSNNCHNCPKIGKV